jgi:glutamate synthase (NADPH/NADH) small chain
MGDPRGFLKHTRELPVARAPQERIGDYKEIYEPFPEEKTLDQASRCMDCGVPFCHSGCPLGNIIPEFNDAVYKEDWDTAFEVLSSTNNFPEFTGRICPAPCEAACVLGINQPPVAIEHIEKTIAEVAYEKGLYKTRPVSADARTGRQVAVIGSGPAGLAAADQLNRAGHYVTVFERKDRVGGLLRYGIPDFKLEKWVVDRRVKIMEEEGIVFKCGVEVGKDLAFEDLRGEYDAVLMCGGSTIPRNLDIPGRELDGVYFAMDFLERNNRRVAGDEVDLISASGKNVVVIGGGDTGSDCVGTSNRHGAASVVQLEVMGKPPEDRDPLSWPNWPLMLRESSSHQEGCDRNWAVLTKRFIGDTDGKLKGIEVVDIDWAKDLETGKMRLVEKEGSIREIPCELALLAIGFVHPQHEGMIEQVGVELDERGNVKSKGYRTSVDGVFAAGDMRRGQSLVVWAIAEGREAAKEVEEFFTE